MRSVATRTIFVAASLLAATLGFEANAKDARKTIPEACKAVKKLAVPEDQMPSMKDRDKLDKCSSEALYYGIGIPADPLMARHCAVTEDEVRSEFVFSGNSILMMIYANGKGAKQNYDLALHFACEVDGSPAEVEGRVAHLVELKKDAVAKPNFDFCDDITSGFMQGQCAAHQQRIAKVEVEKSIETMRLKMSPAELASFDLLRKAADQYAFSHSREEIDLSGSARPMFVIEAQREQTSKFMASVKQLSAGQVPEAEPKVAQDIDRKLNRTYAALGKAKTLRKTTITFDGIQKTQKLWLKYRDAWVAYGRVKSPTLSASALIAWQTAKRVEILQGLNAN
jgi:uncharacterized protein YecT (DUF1311 family)